MVMKPCLEPEDVTEHLMKSLSLHTNDIAGELRECMVKQKLSMVCVEQYAVV